VSRSISATNLTEINASHLHEVVMVKFEFDTPVYVHSGIGTIVYNSNSYLGVGDFGGVTDARESEMLGPQPITLTLSAVNSTYLGEALDAGNYGDPVTIYIGYRQDDGTLVDDPWVVWKGTFEYASLSLGSANAISIVCQHDLAMLNDSDGSRFTDEDQQQRFSGDVGFEFVQDSITAKLVWGGGRVSIGERSGRGAPWYKEGAPGTRD